MNKKNTLPISFVLVVYNEEKLIERALLSCYDLADEIIIVHDGECKDKTLEIAKKYTDKIYIRPHIGSPEAHRDFSYSVAKNEWIFQLDADEYLSDELRKNLADLIKENVDAYDLYWPLMHKNKNLLSYHKSALFKKSKVYFIGSLHQYVKPIDKSVVFKKSMLQLCHKPNYDNLDWKIFKTKWLKWARINAADYKKDFSKIFKWNYFKDEWDFPTSIRLKYPRFIGMFLTPMFHFCKGFKDCIWQRSFYLLKNEILIGLYFFMVYYYYLKQGNKSPDIHLTKKLPISAVSVIYNEEKLLERCLSSFADLVDEIIIIHDGPCHDRSLEIAKKFTDKIFVRERRGHCEPHRVIGFEMAKNEWILMPDADEYLSKDLRNALPNLIAGNADVYKFSLPIIKNNKRHNLCYKTALFKKSKVYFIGSTHQYPKPINKNTVVQKVKYKYYHAPVESNITISMFKKKWLPWAKIQAKDLASDFKTIPKWNYNKDEWDFPTNVRIKRPIIIGMILTPVYHILYAIIKSVTKRSLYLLRFEMHMAGYYFFVYYFYRKFNKTGYKK